MSRSRVSRRGYALIEMVLVISAVAMITGLCAGLLHLLMRIDRTARAHLVETATVGRLARQLRHDVHAAVAATPSSGPDSPELELALPDSRRVAYHASEHVLTRTEHAASGAPRRETYTLPSCPDPRFRVAGAKSAGNGWVALQLPRSPGRGDDPRNIRQSFQIDALLARDHRFSPAQGPAAREEAPR